MAADSALIAEIANNTTATTVLVGTVWVFMGFLAFMLCGLAVIYYTFKGR